MTKAYLEPEGADAIFEAYRSLDLESLLAEMLASGGLPDDQARLLLSDTSPRTS